MDVSIIIPCYNHGRFLSEALESIELSKGNYSYEVIIMNDGSTEEATLEKLSQIEEEGKYKVIHQTNQGLAAARNNAIKIALGKYIIPLDSDNKLHRNYLTKAVELLEHDESIDVVYANPVFFGEENGLRQKRSFRFEDIIEANDIDACAVFRRSIWVRVQGYDGNMPAMGNEDWEFWVHIFLLKGKFYFLDEIGFYYRCSSDSMSVKTTRPGYELNREYIHQKHSKAIIQNLASIARDLRGKVEYTTSYLSNKKMKSVIKIVLGYKI